MIPPFILRRPDGRLCGTFHTADEAVRRARASGLHVYLRHDVSHVVDVQLLHKQDKAAKSANGATRGQHTSTLVHRVVDGVREIRVF